MTLKNKPITGTLSMAAIVTTIAASTPISMLPREAKAALNTCQTQASACAAAPATDTDLSCAHNAFVIGSINYGSGCGTSLLASRHNSCRLAAQNCGYVFSDTVTSEQAIAGYYRNVGASASRSTVAKKCAGATRVESIVVHWGVPDPDVTDSGKRYVRRIEIRCSVNTSDAAGHFSWGKYGSASRSAYTCAPGRLMSGLTFYYNIGGMIGVLPTCRKAAKNGSFVLADYSVGPVLGLTSTQSNALSCTTTGQKFISGLSLDIATFNNSTYALGSHQVFEGADLFCR